MRRITAVIAILIFITMASGCAKLWIPMETKVSRTWKPAIFRQEMESWEKQEALRKIERFYDEAESGHGAIAEIASQIPGAEHNIEVITHCADLAHKFGHHTRAFIDIAKLAASCDYECKKLRDIAEMVVLRLPGTVEVIQVAELAIKARSREEKEHVRAEMEELRATADYGSIEEALEAQRQRRS